jgi:ribosomal protein S18 acetylase RimI-like enzyme
MRTGATVRQAEPVDGPAVAAAVSRLLVELGGAPASLPELERAAGQILADENAGLLLLAEDEAGEVVGFLGCSWQQAVRTAGRYGLIQELWVSPERRGRSVGASLLTALAGSASEGGILRIEVGLPGERYQQRAETEAFYVANGYTAVGTRMRRLL